MVKICRNIPYRGLMLVGFGAICGALFVVSGREARGQKAGEVRTASRRTPSEGQPGETYLRQSPGAVAPDASANDYGLGTSHASKLEPYPQPCQEGMRTPFALWRYAGNGRSSWGSPQLRMSFGEWLELHRVQKPKLMSDVRNYMDSRYDFSGKTIPGVFMSGGRK